MAVIVAVGVYVPAGRIDRRVVGAAWASPARTGQCAVAAEDEDAVTLAVTAAGRALSRVAADAPPPQTLVFATSTPPLQDVAHAVIVAAALDLPENTDARDIVGGPASGLDALVTACDAVDAGAADRALVVVAERSDPAPGSAAEQQRGDAAVALLIGSTAGEAEILGRGACRNVAMSGWHPAADRYARVFEPRLDVAAAQADYAVQAAAAALRHAKTTPDEVRALAVTGPAAVGKRVEAALALPHAERLAGVPDRIGETGPVEPLLRVGQAIESCNRDDIALIVTPAQGATALVLRVAGSATPALTAALTLSYDIEGYPQLAERRAVYDLPPDQEALNASPVAYWRAQRTVLRREARRCGACGFVQYPPGRRCGSCGARTPYRTQRLATAGHVYTFTNDHLVRGRYTNRPQTRCVVDLENGGRIYTDMTDASPEQTRVGMPVELVLRRRGTRDAFPNYGWKARPKDTDHALA